MTTAIRFATSGDAAALGRFSKRLVGTGFESWPLRALTNHLPGAESRDESFPVRIRTLVADVDGEIRAQQQFFEHELYIHGESFAFAWPNGPLSEAVVDPKYNGLGPALLRHTLKLQPRLMLFGAIGTESAAAKLYRAHRWQSAHVPLYLLPLRSARTLRNIKRLHHPGWRGFMVKLIARSGLTAPIDVCVAMLLRARRRRDLVVERADRFAPWADEVWQRTKGQYAAITRRDSATLDRLYRPGDERARRFRVMERGRAIGWFLLVHRKYEDHPEFGNLRLAFVADALASPADASMVVSAASWCAREDGADACVANWSHKAWTAASRACGYIPVPNSTTLFVSKAAATIVLTDDLPLDEFHLTRGDCDGPHAFKPPHSFTSER